jgi:hypothetical protein
MTMYRLIDTVSIDAMSITGYYLIRKPREEGTVEAGTQREVRLGDLIEDFLGEGARGPREGSQREVFS